MSIKQIHKFRMGTIDNEIKTQGFKEDFLSQ
jgi:hypothetical protein